MTMTYEQAMNILKTHTKPMTAEKLKIYKQALQVVANNGLKPLGVG